MRLVLLAAAVAACGTDSGPCGPDGTATVTGSVKGKSIKSIGTAYELRTTDGVALAFVESGIVCGEPDATAQDLVILLCGTPVATRYDVISDASFACPTAGADVIYEMNGGTDFAKSSGGGDLTISAADDKCVTGTFSAVFDGEMLTGDFDAVVCP